jgi:hypothetical protein
MAGQLKPIRDQHSEDPTAEQLQRVLAAINNTAPVHLNEQDEEELHAQLSIEEDYVEAPQPSEQADEVDETDDVEDATDRFGDISEAVATAILGVMADVTEARILLDDLATQLGGLIR